MIEPVLNKYNSIIFLDCDGVLNCQLFYEEKFAHVERFDNIPLYKTARKHLRKLVKSKEISSLDYYKRNICPKRISLLNALCTETNSAVVLTASMRNGHTIEEIQEIFKNCGATFNIIDKTPHTGYERGTEISKWLKDNCDKWFDVNYYDFYRYAIIDDDKDMLISQQFNFFPVDNYSGLTPTTCYQIKRFFTHKTF
jgi:hypothetical protein